MKKIALFFSTMIVASLAWMGFIREPLPALPVVCAELSERVPLNFVINRMDYTSLEFALADKLDGKGMFLQFSMAKTWKTGRTGLVLSSIREASGFNIGMPPTVYLKDEKRLVKGEKDFSDFMKDSRGKSISTYAFTQQLVEARDGKMYMQISYSGPAMEMLQTLEVSRPLTLPAPVSRKFVSKGIIQFQPGTVAFDDKIKGFSIPVTVR